MNGGGNGGGDEWDRRTRHSGLHVRKNVLDAQSIFLGSPKFSLLKGRELPLWGAARMACRQGGDWRFTASMHHTPSGHLEMEIDGKGFWAVRMTGGLCWLTSWNTWMDLQMINFLVLNANDTLK